VVCLTALAVTAAAFGARLAEAVTLRVDVRFDPGVASREITFAGRVSSGAAGEVVEVQAKECGRNRFYRLIAGSRTVSGGSWVLDNETGGVDMFSIPPNAYFRARWKGNYSNVVLVRVPLTVWARWNPRRRTVRVSVSASSTGYSFSRPLRRATARRRWRTMGDGATGAAEPDETGWTLHDRVQRADARPDSPRSCARRNRRAMLQGRRVRYLALVAPTAIRVAARGSPGTSGCMGRLDARRRAVAALRRLRPWHRS
jgi:hypothetical protein